MKLAWLIAMICLFTPRIATADAPPATPAAAPAPAAVPEPKPDPAEEQHVTELKVKEAARLETEIAALRAESARQLEEKITAARSKSERELNDSVSYFRARHAEDRANVISTNPQASGNMRVLRRVDRSLTTERALLLLPDGPLVMQLSITMDGKPLQNEAEDILDEMLTAADTNQDGQTTWQEAFACPDFRIGSLGADPENLKGDKLLEQIKLYDANRDGMVARAEARLLLAGTSGGPSFTVQTMGPQQQGQFFVSFDGSVTDAVGEAKSPIETLIDTDGDGQFTRRELLSASWRLKLRDRNDDDTIEFAELFDNRSPFYFNGGGRSRTSASPAAMLALLGPTADWEALWKLLGERYARAGRVAAEWLPLSKDLLSALDKNKNSALDREEITELNQVEPQFTVTANLGKAGEKVESLQVATKIPCITASGSVDPKSNGFTLELPGVRLSIVPDMMQQNWRDSLDGQVKNIFDNYDVDKNGYIEQSELSEELRKQLERQYKSWDANGDGKVYPDELRGSFIRSQRPQWSRISLAAIEQQHAIFHALDVNGDGQLGERELQTAQQRLASSDANRDGRLSPGEVPKAIRLAVGRAVYVNQLLQPPSGFNQFRRYAQPKEPTRAGPSWFTRMDVNGDCDVSRREFLGPAGKFAPLDKNRDNFIDTAEAVEASTVTQQAAK